MKKYILIFVSFVLLMGSVFPQDTLTKKALRKQQKSFLLTNRAWTAGLPLWIPGYAGYFAHGEIEVEGEDGINPSHPIEPPPGGEIGKIISRLFSERWFFKFFFGNYLPASKLHKK